MAIFCFLTGTPVTSFLSRIRAPQVGQSNPARMHKSEVFPSRVRPSTTVLNPDSMSRRNNVPVLIKNNEPGACGSLINSAYVFCH